MNKSHHFQPNAQRLRNNTSAPTSEQHPSRSYKGERPDENTNKILTKPSLTPYHIEHATDGQQAGPKPARNINSNSEHITQSYRVTPGTVKTPRP